MCQSLDTSRFKVVQRLKVNLIKFQLENNRFFL